MKRSPLKPSRRMLAKRLIADHNREQEALQIRERIDAAQAEHDARPRIDPKHPPKILPLKETRIILQTQKPIIMRTIDGRECSIRDHCSPGTEGEPVTVPEIVFDSGDVKTLNRDTLRLFHVVDRIILEEYMNDVEMMNEEYALMWVE